MENVYYLFRDFILEAEVNGQERKSINASLKNNDYITYKDL